LVQFEVKLCSFCHLHDDCHSCIYTDVQKMATCIKTEQDAEVTHSTVAKIFRNQTPVRGSIPHWSFW